MAYMQQCRPACEATYSETETTKCSNGSQGYYSSEHKHQEHQTGSYGMNQAGHHMGGMHHNKHPSHNNYSQGCHSSEYKHHESSGYPSNQGGHHNHSSHNGYSTGHHGMTDKIKETFGSIYGHNSTHHGSHHGSHHATSGCTEKKEEHMSYKSGDMKSKIYKKKTSSYKCKDDSSDSESDKEGCRKRC